MTYVVCPTPIRKVLFEVPVDILNTFNVPTKYREIHIDDIEYLRIWCTDEEYTRTVNGSQSEYINSTAYYYFSPNIVRVGFTINSIISEFQVVACMEYISRISASTGYEKHIPIRCLDFVRPEPEDYIKPEWLNPFTERFGKLQVNSDKGTIGYDRALGLGIPNLNIIFEETKQRLIG